MYQLDILSDDRRAYTATKIGTRDEVSRELAELRMAYKVFGECRPFLGAPGYRIHKAGSAPKFKLPHSITVPRDSAYHGISVKDQAKRMAERIKATMQTVLSLFPDHCPAAREFNAELRRALSVQYSSLDLPPVMNRSRGFQSCRPVRERFPDELYTVVTVSPADYSPKAIAEEIRATVSGEYVPMTDAA